MRRAPALAVAALAAVAAAQADTEYAAFMKTFPSSFVQRKTSTNGTVNTATVRLQIKKGQRATASASSCADIFARRFPGATITCRIYRSGRFNDGSANNGASALPCWLAEATVVPDRKRVVRAQNPRLNSADCRPEDRLPKDR